MYARSTVVMRWNIVLGRVPSSQYGLIILKVFIFPIQQVFYKPPEAAKESKLPIIDKWVYAAFFLYAFTSIPEACNVVVVANNDDGMLAKVSLVRRPLLLL